MNPTTVTRNSAAAPFAAVFGAMVLVFAGAQAAAPLWPVYRAELHLTSTALTIVFVAYTLGALIALFALGGLSDIIGRKPLLIGAVGATIVASLLFAFATNVVWLFAARLVQGLAIGAVSASANAALADFADPAKPRQAPLAGSIATSAGFAIGPFVTGALADYAPDPTQTSYFVLMACAAIALVAMLRLPNTGRRPGAAFTGTRASVPAEIRMPFVRATATFVAGWIGGGFFLALGPSLIAQLLGTSSHVIAGTTLFVFFLASGIGQALMRRVKPRNTLRTGGAVVAIGVLLAPAAIALHSLPVYFVAIVLTGASQGIALLGGLEILNRIAPPAQRAGVIAAFFFIAYVGVTVVMPFVGWVTDVAGLAVAALGFAIAIAVASLAGVADLSRWHPTDL